MVSAGQFVGESDVSNAVAFRGLAGLWLVLCATASVQAADPVPQVPTAQAAAAAAEARAVAYDAARARCTAQLAKINAVVIPQESIEDGACGSIAPVELVSVGKNPQVVLSPPALLNCDMVVAIHDWMKSDVQPLARKHLGREVVRMEIMSSYSCRNAYGRRLAKLSEHGKANALDIRGFITSTGETAYVLPDWGMTSGEIRAAAAKAEKEQAERQIAAAAAAKAQDDARMIAAAKTGRATASAPHSPSNPIASASTLMEGLPKAALSLSGSSISDDETKSPTSLGMQPSRLGGPKKKVVAAGAEPVAAGTPDTATSLAHSLFLRDVHASACRRFATTLGPESNAAHKNHFHVDLAERSSKSICE
jgi:hypothetical protein